MRTGLFQSVALGLCLLASAPAHAGDSAAAGTVLAAGSAMRMAGGMRPSMPHPAMPHPGIPMGGGMHPNMGGGKPMGPMGMRPNMGGGTHRWGGMQNGRWQAGWQAPGGWNGYRRPVRGYTLPSYWIQPSFYIGSYGAYGLYAPQTGYGWSRYYDDAVLSDRYGRVIDSRSGLDWNRYEGGYDTTYDNGYDDAAYADSDSYYDDGGYPDDVYASGDTRAYVPAPRRDNGVGGALIGGALGGVIGNRVAGRGDRLAGTLVGAGVGALAGAAVDMAEDQGWGPDPRPTRVSAPRRPSAPVRRRAVAPPPANYDVGYGDDGVTYNNEYSGRWVGTWYGNDGTTYSGEYAGDYSGTARAPVPPHAAHPAPPPGVGYDAPPPPAHPHWADRGPDRGSARAPVRASSPRLPYAGGYVSNGFYYPAPTITTVTIQPAVTTTTTTFVEETVVYSKPAPRKRRAVVKPRRVCTCG